MRAVRTGVLLREGGRKVALRVGDTDQEERVHDGERNRCGRIPTCAPSVRACSHHGALSSVSISRYTGRKAQLFALACLRTPAVGTIPELRYRGRVHDAGDRCVADKVGRDASLQFAQLVIGWAPHCSQCHFAMPLTGHSKAPTAVQQVRESHSAVQHNAPLNQSLTINHHLGRAFQKWSCCRAPALPFPAFISSTGLAVRSLVRSICTSMTMTTVYGHTSACRHSAYLSSCEGRCQCRCHDVATRIQCMRPIGQSAP